MIQLHEINTNVAKSSSENLYWELTFLAHSTSEQQWCFLEYKIVLSAHIRLNIKHMTCFRTVNQALISLANSKMTKK